MMFLRIVLVTLGVAAMLFAVVTLVALEGGEVVVLRTIDEHGAARDTRTWVADADGALWIEAANPDRPFLLHIRRQPDVELRRAGVWRSCHASVAANPEGHERIRRLLRERYGWKDWWIGLLTDTSGSLAVRLQCR